MQDDVTHSFHAFPNAEWSVTFPSAGTRPGQDLDSTNSQFNLQFSLLLLMGSVGDWGEGSIQLFVSRIGRQSDFATHGKYLNCETK